MAGPLPSGVPWGLFRCLSGTSGAFRAPWELFEHGLRTSSGAKGPLLGPPRGAWTFLGLCDGLRGSPSAPLPNQMCTNSVKTNGFLICLIPVDRNTVVSLNGVSQTQWSPCMVFVFFSFFWGKPIRGSIIFGSWDRNTVVSL